MLRRLIPGSSALITNKFNTASFTTQHPYTYYLAQAEKAGDQAIAEAFGRGQQAGRQSTDNLTRKHADEISDMCFSYRVKMLAGFGIGIGVGVAGTLFYNNRKNQNQAPQLESPEATRSLSKP